MLFTLRVLLYILYKVCNLSHTNEQIYIFEGIKHRDIDTVNSIRILNKDN